MLVVFGPKFRGPGSQCRQARPTYLTLMSSGKHFQNNLQLASLSSAAQLECKMMKHTCTGSQTSSPICGTKSAVYIRWSKITLLFCGNLQTFLWHLADIFFCGIVNSCAAWRDNDRIQASMQRYDNMQAKNAKCEHMESPERQTHEIHKHFGQNSHFFNRRRSHRL